MPIGKLSSLQERVLRLLADIEPPWTLTGGAALAGFHTHHRATRDLDLFFRPQAALGTVIGAVREHLERDGLNVAGVRRRERDGHRDGMLGRSHAVPAMSTCGSSSISALWRRDGDERRDHR